MRKTFLTSFALLLFLAPTVSMAAGISDLPGLVGSFFTSVAAIQDQTALSATSLLFGGSDPAKLDLRVNGDNGPISVSDGTQVTARWYPYDILAFRAFSKCSLSYPGRSARTTQSVSSFGFLHLALYPSQSTPSSVDISCTRNSQPVTDSVSILTPQARAAQAGQQPAPTAARLGGGSVIGVGGINLIGAFSAPGGSYQLVPIGNTGISSYMFFPGSGGLGDSAADAAAQKLVEIQAQ